MQRPHAPQALFVAPDYSADGLWYQSDGAHAYLDDLPLSDETKVALRQWSRWFDGTLDVREREPGQRYFATADEARRFDYESVRLWAVVRDELGPAWPVQYRSGRDPLPRRAAEVADASGVPTV